MADFVEKALDEVALFVEFGSEGRRRAPIGLGGMLAIAPSGVGQDGRAVWRPMACDGIAAACKRRST